MTLRSTVTAITATAWSAPVPSSSSASRAKTSEASPRGPNQPTNRTVFRSRPAPIEGQRHRQHPHHRQAEDRVHTMAGSIRSSMMGTAMAPKASHTSRDTRPLACSRNCSSRAAPAGHGPESQAAAERGDEAVAVSPQATVVGEDGQGEHRDAGEVLGGPVARRARRSSAPPATRPHRRRRRRRRARAGRLRAGGASKTGRGGRAGDREHDHRGGDAVVEAALDGDEAPDRVPAPPGSSRRGCRARRPWAPVRPPHALTGTGSAARLQWRGLGYADHIHPTGGTQRCRGRSD